MFNKLLTPIQLVFFIFRLALCFGELLFSRFVFKISGKIPPSNSPLVVLVAIFVFGAILINLNNQPQTTTQTYQEKPTPNPAPEIQVSRVENIDLHLEKEEISVLEKKYSRFVQQNPSNLEGLINLAIIKKTLGELEKSQELIDRAQKINPNHQIFSR